jgi:ketol-acid reductoisomerase
MTQSLVPLIGKNGLDWMYANCSTTAQRGALDWLPQFKDATLPVFERLYNEVSEGREAQRTIDKNSQPDYREELSKELQQMHDREIWRVGRTVRKLRPENSDNEKN